ncbi:MAG TPA: sugar ABC transporter permease [Chloroflexota bacterium]|nr:sugar ABC transporter permease [Chloroflexota bacterium]
MGIIAPTVPPGTATPPGAAGPPAAPPLVARPGRRARQENITGWLWTSPWILGFFLWTLGPMVWSLYLAFTRYNISQPAEWTGLSNFTTALSGQDSLFWPSLTRTFIWAAVMVPLSLAGSLTSALLLNQGMKGTSVFRTLYFLPSLTPAVASAILWRFLFQPDFGPINYVLRALGVTQPPLWFSDARLAMPSLMIMTLWAAVGGSTMLIFLAGLQGVPQELHEAASIDGAGRWARFRNVTLPMITPTLFFNLVIGIIAALRTFTTAYVATGGGPNYATWFYILHLYQTAFQNFDFGYASALAWIFFVIVIALTLLNNRFSRRWVYYEGEARP